MRTLALLAMMGIMAAAEAPKPTPTAPATQAPKPVQPQPQPEPMTREEMLALENLQLRSQLLQNAAQELQRDVCVNHKLDPANCVMDQNTRTVSARPATPPRPAAPAAATPPITAKASPAPKEEK